jgi:Protein of unknown function (DUF3500)
MSTIKFLCFLLIPMSLVSQSKTIVHSGSKAAENFIQSLSPEQKIKARFSFDEMSRFNWHFVPGSQSERDGIVMKTLNQNQKNLAFEILQCFLSDKGFEKTKGIMNLEYVLQQIEPKNSHRIPENYSIAIYGEPHKDSIWGWKFGGHHIALNFTIVKDQIAFAPFFFGSNPGNVKEGIQKGYRALHDEEDFGFELLNALDSIQTQKAVFNNVAYKEIVTTNSPKVSPLKFEGIVASELNNTQKILLIKLIHCYLSAMPEKLAAARIKKIKNEDFNNIYFGWAGALNKDSGHYYRVQGKTFLIEFDNTQNNANHIHTVWRDFNGGDYGEDLIQEHYQKHQH